MVILAYKIWPNRSGREKTVFVRSTSLKRLAAIWTPSGLAEMVLEVVGNWSETFHLCRKAFERTLPGGGMLSLVIDLAEPEVEGVIEVRQIVSFEAGEKLGSERAKETLDLSLSLWFVGPCVDQCNSQRGRHMLHMM